MSTTIKKHDNVNHPAHYTAGGIECIDAIKAALTCHRNPTDAWLTGQVLKYMWRWPLKNGLEDLRKAEYYIKKLIAEVGERATNQAASEFIATRVPTSDTDADSSANASSVQGDVRL